MSAVVERIGVVSDLIPLAELLDFEEAHPRNGGRKEEAIIRTFGMKPARYFQQLGRAIDTLEAEAMRPLLVHRLRRIRDAADLQRRQRLDVG